KGSSWSSGTSCLTCKRRHKKCDLRQPVCKRCEVGRFECEGYGHNKRGPARKARSEAPHLREALEDEGSSSHSTSLGPVFERAPSLPGDRSEDTASASSPGSPTSPDLSIETIDSELPSSDSTFSLAKQQTNRVEDYLRLFATRTTLEGPAGPMSILRKIINLQSQLPYYPIDPLKTFLTSPWFVDYILEQSDKVMDHWYFKPTNYPKKRFRKDVVLRLHNSPFTRWIALIGMSVVECTLSGDMSQDPLHTAWIGYIESTLKGELMRDLSPCKMQERRSNWVYVSVMKTMVIHSSSSVLRPTLWSNGCDPTCVPLSNILSSEAHELAYFALLDFEYDTTRYAQPSSSSAQPNPSPSHQWAHKYWLLTWQSRPAEYAFTESWMTIAWYAVQESWRLALLAYLYMMIHEYNPV
ncbi:hypothetical protein B0J17DRAFT_660861, partial [Rhizoctonia solani]